MALHFPCSRHQLLASFVSGTVPSAELCLQEGRGPGRRGWLRITSRSWMSWTKPKLLMPGGPHLGCSPKPHSSARLNPGPLLGTNLVHRGPCCPGSYSAGPRYRTVTPRSQYIVFLCIGDGLRGSHPDPSPSPTPQKHGHGG